MKGILVVNGFLMTNKFRDLYDFFRRSANELGIKLEVRTSSELYTPVGASFRQKPDFVLFWDKDLFLAKQFEEQGVRVFNSSRAIALCDDKALTARALKSAGIRSPLTMIAPKTYSNIGYSNESFLLRAEKYLDYPYVIKHRCGSFGAQVFLVHDREEAKKVCTEAGGNEVILQQYVGESCGRDLRINVVGGKICGVILRENKNDFRSNITLGGSMSPFNAEKRYLNIALRAAKAVNADFAGVDVLFGRQGPVVCEVNASPHFKTTYLCTGIDLSRLILKHILGESGKK